VAAFFLFSADLCIKGQRSICLWRSVVPFLDVFVVFVVFHSKPEKCFEALCFPLNLKQLDCFPCPVLHISQLKKYRWQKK
jgi:hypothetical protein